MVTFWPEGATRKDKTMFTLWVVTATVLIARGLQELRNARHEGSMMKAVEQQYKIGARVCDNCLVGDLSHEACPNDSALCIWCCVCHRDEALDQGDTRWARDQFEKHGRWPTRGETKEFYRLDADMDWCDVLGELAIPPYSAIGGLAAGLGGLGLGKRPGETDGEMVQRRREAKQSSTTDLSSGGEQ